VIKFKAQGNGRTLVGLGITDENIKRLRQGMPIIVRLADVGVPGGIEVTIFWGETETAIRKDLQKHGLIGPETEIRIGVGYPEPEAKS
jgi:hypothetical protein